MFDVQPMLLTLVHRATEVLPMGVYLPLAVVCRDSSRRNPLGREALSDDSRAMAILPRADASSHDLNAQATVFIPL